MKGHTVGYRIAPTQEEAKKLADEIEAGHGLILLKASGVISQLGINRTTQIVAALRRIENAAR